jgi:hypothetical protein
MCMDFRMSDRGRKATSAAVVAVVSGLFGGVSWGVLTPIALDPSSFNYNTVVTSGTPGSSATIVGGTPTAIDTENGISFYGPSFSSSGALPAAGTPFTSAGNPNTQFQFASFTGNNTLLINADQKFSAPGSSAYTSTPPFYAPPYAQTGSLVLASTAQAGYSNLAVLYTAAGQDYYGDIPSIGYTLNFKDGTSYNNSGAASFQGYGWGGVYGPNTPDPSSTLAATVDRVWVNSGNSNYGKPSGNFYLYEADITVPTADVNKVLTGISFYDSGSGYYGASSLSDPNSLAVYGLSGTLTAVPEPLSSGFAVAGAAVMLLRRRGAARARATENSCELNPSNP